MVVHALSVEQTELEVACFRELLAALHGEVECAVLLPKDFSFDDLLCNTRVKIFRLDDNLRKREMLSKIYIYRSFFKKGDWQVAHSHGSVEAALGALGAGAGRSLVKDFYASELLGRVFLAAGRSARNVVTLAFGERHKSVIEECCGDGGRVVSAPYPCPPRHNPLSYSASARRIAAICRSGEECARLVRGFSTLGDSYVLRIFAPRELWGVIFRFAALCGVGGQVEPCSDGQMYSVGGEYSLLVIASSSVSSAAVALFSSAGIPMISSDICFTTGLVGEECCGVYRYGDPFSLSECLKRVAEVKTAEKRVSVHPSAEDTARVLIPLYRSLL